MEDRFFSYIKNLISNYKRVLLAVSGGPDSIFMLYMIKKLKFDCLAVTVDHSLRAESRSEAVHVNNICNILNIPHKILTWHHDFISVNHDKAREARYDLLIKHAEDTKAECLLIGNHKDDLIEHYIIRSEKTNSPLGLSFFNVSNIRKIPIIRALMPFYKTEIEEYLNANNIKYFIDQSNFNLKYKRAQIRKNIAFTFDEKENIVTKVNNINEKFVFMKKYFWKLFFEFKYISYPIISIELNKFLEILNNEDEQYIIWFFQYFITKIGNLKKYPRYDSIQQFLSKELYLKNFKKTLGSTVIELNSESGVRFLYLYREGEIYLNEFVGNNLCNQTKEDLSALKVFLKQHRYLRKIKNYIPIIELLDKRFMSHDYNLIKYNSNFISKLD
jgi:tRNA(Ile)-lysidine synthase